MAAQTSLLQEGLDSNKKKINVFQASASWSFCLGSMLGCLLGVSAWDLFFGSLVCISASVFCLGLYLWISAFKSLLWVSVLAFCFGPLLRFSLGLSLVGPLLCQVSSPSDLSFGSHVWVSPLGVCFCSMHWVANKGLYFGSLLWSLPEFHFSLGSLLGVSS